MYKIILISLFTITCITPVLASNKLSTDHPLISRFEGAQYFYHHTFDYIPSHILFAPFDKEHPEASVLKVEGKGSYIKYQTPSAASWFEVVESFKQKLASPIFSNVFECEKTKTSNTCGKDIRAFESIYSVTGGFQTLCAYEDKAYIANATVVRPDGKKTYVYICMQGKDVNQTIIEEKDFNTNKITVANNYAPNTASLSALRKQTKKDIAGAKDHPLINRFPNSIITKTKSIDFVNVKLPVKPIGVTEQLNFTDDLIIKTSGKVTFIEYQGQEGLSQYQVYKNYLEGIENASNMTLLFSCDRKRGCKGEINDYSTIQSTVPSLSISDGCQDQNVSVINAKVALSPTQNGYLFICISDWTSLTISQTIVEEKPLQTGFIQLSTDEMANEIAAKGKVAIYGIHFATNSDQIMKTSAPAFKQLADLFTKQPTLNLYVVGHTDSQGEEAYNQVLAEKRAKAVIKTLVEEYKIAPQKLKARGVGELVPVSTNQASEGRQLNRRVELVEM